MALAILANCATILNQLLNRNRASYASTGGTGANQLGAYPFDAEITDSLLRADGLVIVNGYFHSENLALRNRFLTVSSNLTSGDKMPEFEGLIGKAEWSADNATWKDSKEQASKDDVTGAIQQGAYVGSTSFRGLHHFADGCAYHTSPYFRFSYPVYTRTAALQCLEQHEPLIINFAAELLYKANVQVAYDWYQRIRIEQLDRVIHGAMRLKEPLSLPADIGV